MKKMSDNNEIEFDVFVKEYGKGELKQFIKPYCFIEFEDGIKRVIHEDRVEDINDKNN